MSRLIQLAVVFCSLILFCQAAVPAAAGQPRDQDALLRQIKRRLGPTKVSENRWFVLLLREQTSTRISVRYVKVQGRESAAQELLNFATAPTNTFKDFAFKSFPGTDKGDAEATAFHASQVAAGLNAVLLAKLTGLGY
ncbi:MAG: hypothetical protein J5I93_05220 [Pirellulaceae bacterium]|nr:hypothetical protein [Pirellulaceae bacterium]